MAGEGRSYEVRWGENRAAVTSDRGTLVIDTNYTTTYLPPREALRIAEELRSLAIAALAEEPKEFIAEGEADGIKFRIGPIVAKSVEEAIEKWVDAEDLVGFAEMIRR